MTEQELVRQARQCRLCLRIYYGTGHACARASQARPGEQPARRWWRRPGAKPAPLVPLVRLGGEMDPAEVAAELRALYPHRADNLTDDAVASLIRAMQEAHGPGTPRRHECPYCLQWFIGYGTDDPLRKHVDLCTARPDLGDDE